MLPKHKEGKRLRVGHGHRRSRSDEEEGEYRAWEILTMFLIWVSCMGVRKYKKLLKQYVLIFSCTENLVFYQILKGMCGSKKLRTSVLK